jgi:hypothetical protein
MQFFTMNGAYTLGLVPSGFAYDVTVTGQPSDVGEVCTVANPTGVIGTASVTNVNVTCGDQITANVYAPPNISIAVTLNSYPPLSVLGAGAGMAAPVKFPEPVPGGMAYTVTGAGAPPHTCMTMPAAPIAGTTNTVSVTCN